MHPQQLIGVEECANPISEQRKKAEPIVLNFSVSSYCTCTHQEVRCLLRVARHFRQSEANGQSLANLASPRLDRKTFQAISVAINVNEFKCL